tara:strand:- start:972 stop:1715 length:744 start_codon:yes stop_codon:yes gene_type:complete
MYKRKIKDQEYVIYDNEEEFRKHRPKDKIQDDWRVAKTDEWIITDDGKITQVIKRDYLNNKNKKEYYIRTLFGMSNCKKTKSIKGEPVKNIWSFSKQSWYDNTLYGDLSNEKRLFAKYIASGLKPVDAYMKSNPKCSSKDHAEKRTRILLRSEKVKNLIDKEIEILLNDTGITKSYLLEQTKDIVEKHDAKDSDKLRAIETLMKISGLLNPEKTKESLALIQEFSGFSQEKLEAFKQGALLENGKKG